MVLWRRRGELTVSTAFVLSYVIYMGLRVDVSF